MSESEFCLHNKFVPYIFWKLCVGGGQRSEKMIFP